MSFPEPRPHETKIYLQDAREWHKRKKQAFAVAYRLALYSGCVPVKKFSDSAAKLHIHRRSDRGRDAAEIITTHETMGVGDHHNLERPEH